MSVSRGTREELNKMLSEKLEPGRSAMDHMLPESPSPKVETRKKETVNHPSHYNQGKIEVIDFLKDQGLGLDFCLGNALKYICRAKHKGKPKEDIAKAIWYLQNCGIE